MNSLRQQWPRRIFAHFPVISHSFRDNSRLRGRRVSRNELAISEARVKWWFRDKHRRPPRCSTGLQAGTCVEQQRNAHLCPYTAFPKSIILANTNLSFLRKNRRRFASSDDRSDRAFDPYRETGVSPYRLQQDLQEPAQRRIIYTPSRKSNITPVPAGGPGILSSRPFFPTPRSRHSRGFIRTHPSYTVGGHSRTLVARKPASGAST